MERPELIELQRHLDPRGNLAIIEEMEHVPFKIKRVHWIYDVPGGGERWGHAYRRNSEFIVAISGSFDVIVDSGDTRETFTLNRSYIGLSLPAGLWRKLDNFSTNAVAVVLSSEPYDESDYMEDFEQYLNFRKEIADASAEIKEEMK